MSAQAEVFFEQLLGPCRVRRDWSWSHGGSQVLQIRDRTGSEWYVKTHRSAERYLCEVTAYRRWVPALGDRAPTLCASDDASRTLVLSTVPGVAPDSPSVDVHRQAGALLRLLHDSEPGEVWTGLAAEKRSELDRWTAYADGLLDRRELDFAQAQVRQLDGLPSPLRVPCHLDYSPRNWLVADGLVRVIDFELAGPEVWVNDLTRLYFGAWRADPRLRDAFCAGYGRELDSDDHALLRACFPLAAVRHLAWAAEHHQASFSAAVRRILHTLMRGEFT